MSAVTVTEKFTNTVNLTHAKASVSGGILVVKRWGGWGWVEASAFVDGTASEVCVDCECAPPREVDLAVRELAGLMEWCVVRMEKQ